MNLTDEYYKKSHNLAERIGYAGYTQMASEILSLTAGLIRLIEKSEEENDKLKKEVERLKGVNVK